MKNLSTSKRKTNTGFAIHHRVTARGRVHGARDTNGRSDEVVIRAFSICDADAARSASALTKASFVELLSHPIAARGLSPLSGTEELGK